MKLKSRECEKAHLESLPNIHTKFLLSFSIRSGNMGRTALFQRRKERTPV